MKTTKFIIFLLLINSVINVQKVQSQSKQLLTEVNFFNVNDVAYKLDRLKLYNSSTIRLEKAKSISKNITELKQKCVLGFVYSNLLINKLNYYNDRKYISELAQIKKIYKNIFNNLKVVQSEFDNMLVNTASFDKRKLRNLRKKVKICIQNQNKLHKKSGILANILKWEKKQAVKSI